MTLAGEYEELVDAASPGYEFADFDENTRATTFYTTGTTDNPKGVYFSHRQLVLHTIAALAALGTSAMQGRFHRADMYMPVTPMFHVRAWGVPYMATVMGVRREIRGSGSSGSSVCCRSRSVSCWRPSPALVPCRWCG